jgi:uncharacterized damage-inducible protein DinB
MNLHEFLTSPVAYMPPARAVEGLSAELAERRPERVTHSVAEIVAHLSFWQQWFHARCLGQPVPMASSASVGWPAVAAGSWPVVQADFLKGLDAVAGLADGDITRRLSPSIEFPPLAEYTIGDVLVHVSTHNGHHLGQVIVVRQLLGAWPPPAGSWTW